MNIPTILLCLLFIMRSTVVCSQIENKRDSISIRGQEEIGDINSKMTPVKNNLEKKTLESRTYRSATNQQLSQSFYIPEVNISPEKKLNRNFAYTLMSVSDVVTGIGLSNTAGGCIMYKPFGRLNLSLGGYGIKYSTLRGAFNDFTLNMNAMYNISNRFDLLLFGEYAMNANRNALAGGYMLSPLSNYGAIVFIKTNNQSSFGLGVEKSYDSLTKSWDISPIFCPKIRWKKR